MKKTIVTFAAFALLALIATGSRAYAGTLTYYYASNCANGFAGAYIIVAVDDLGGCIDGIWGVDCSGKHFSFSGPKMPLPGDLGLTYQAYFFGTVSGLGDWYAKVQVGDEGVMKAWGRQADGQYYQIVSGS